MVKVEFKGKEFEFRGEYAIPDKGEYFISACNPFIERAIMDLSVERAIVHPVEKYYDFGGVRFKETGEVRVPCNQWALMGGEPEYISEQLGCTYPILEPVEILPK